MSRLLPGIFIPLASLAAFAQDVKPEPPVEHASPLVVAVFLVLFVGSCLAYGGYLLWRGKKEKAQQSDELP